MKSSIERIFIFTAAGPTQGEWRHGGGGAVIRQLANQGVTGAALGAINKRITEAAVVRILHFAQAIVAGEVIWWHMYLRGRIFITGKDFECIEILTGRVSALHQNRLRQ